MKKPTFSLCLTAVIEFKEYYFVRRHSPLIEPAVSRVAIQLVPFITIVRKYDISWNQVFLSNRSEVTKSQWTILVWFSDWAPYAMTFRVQFSVIDRVISQIECHRLTYLMKRKRRLSRLFTWSGRYSCKR